MRSKPQKPSFTTRLSESDDLRATIGVSLPEKAPDLGKFCVACDKFYSYLRAEQKLCKACDDRYRTLYGNKD